MKATLIIPTKIKNNVPKPTKAHILEALLEKARERHEKTHADWRLKKEAIEQEIKELILLEIPKLRESDFELNTGIYQYSRTPSPATISASIKTPAITRKQERLIAHYNKQPMFDKEWMKKDLRKKLETPNPLLGNSNVGKAIEDLLDQLTGKPKAIEAQEVEVIND